MDGSNGGEEKSRGQARIPEPLGLASQHAGGYEDIVPEQ